MIRAAAIAFACVLAACAGGYQGPARTIRYDEVSGPGWLRAKAPTFVGARTDDDCGPATVAMLLAAHGISPSPTVHAPAGGASARSLRDELRAHQLRAFVIVGTTSDLEHELALARPVIVGTVKQVDGRPVQHLELVVALHPQQHVIVTFDPAAGVRRSPLAGFEDEWNGSKRTAIVALPP